MIVRLIKGPYCSKQEFIQQQRKMESLNLHTIAIVKPNVLKHIESIETIMKERGFTFCRTKQTTFSKSIWEKFYEEHKGKAFFEPLIDFMSSGPCKVYLLGHKNTINVIQEWRKTIGPTDPKEAKEKSPNSLRALFGNPLVIRENGFHGSDSYEAVERESKILFETN